MRPAMVLRSLSAAGVALLAASVLFSCGTPRVAISTGVSPEEKGLIQESVFFLDRASSRRLEVAALNTSRDVNNRLQVQVRLRNRLPSDFSFVYYFEWLEEGGWVTPKGTATWNPELIYGHGMKELKGVAPSPFTARFRLQIKQK